MNKIEKLRTDLKMSKTEFAKIFNVTIQSVSQWEEGRNLPNQMNQAVMIKLQEKADRKEDVKGKVKAMLLLGGFLALLTWIFSENSKK